MYYDVNELLSLTRLPIHYWNEVNDNEHLYLNPGKQLQSWIVARCLDQETTVLDPVLEPAVQACRDFSQTMARPLDWAEQELSRLDELLRTFSHDKKTDKALLGQLSRRIRHLLTEVADLRDKLVLRIADDTSPLNELIELRGAIDMVQAKFREIGVDPSR